MHNGKYDYSLVDYKNAKIKVKIICPKHGVFEQTPTCHLSGCGCPKCGRERTNGSILLTNAGFIEKAALLHDNKYDYSLVEYKGWDSKVKIICPNHGEFLQTAGTHLKGSGCPVCGKERSKSKNKNKKIKVDNRSFIEKATEVHGHKYNYLFVKYKNSYTKVKIICPDHGEFFQTPYGHLRGNGCPKCNTRQHYSTEDFIEECKKIHNNEYDYSLVNYVNSKSKIKIVCPKHGKFEQIAANHKKGGKCPECLLEKKNTEEFILEASLIHDNKYLYGKTKYEHSKQKVIISCPIHGDFTQTPNTHLMGKGCPQCVTKISNGHQEIADYICSMGYACDLNNKLKIYPFELDILVKNTNIAVEFNGVRWHSYNRKESTKEKMRHYSKCDLCLNNGINLIQIYENEWAQKKEIVKSILSAKLNKNSIIYARNCEIRELNNKEFKYFCCCNHLQGYVPTSIKHGLVYDGKLVCVMGFNRHATFQYEISRFCNILYANVVGGASRILSYFIKLHNPQTILTYADRRYSNGNVYKKLGFNLVDIIAPNYYYVKGINVYNRQKFQKKKLPKLLKNFNYELSESENMFNNKYRRLWNAGNYKFVWNVVNDKD